MNDKNISKCYENGTLMEESEKPYGIEYYEKFRQKLKEALNENKVNFDTKTKFKYKKLENIYRAIERQEDSIGKITPSDFLSYAELGKKVRGISLEHMENNIDYYSCSFNQDKEELKLSLHLPKKNRFIIKGSIEDSYGAILKNRNSGHIHLWIYENAKVYESFEEDNNE